MPRKPNIQKVSSSVRRSVEKFSGDIESLSSQIAGLTDAIISEKNLAASKIKSERELLARKNALQNIKEDIDDLRSERRKNQDKLDRLISDQEKEAEKEKQDNRKEQNYYKDAATNAYKSGKFVSGLIFEFLGRNEKDKKQIEAERKADRQDQIEGLRNRSKELSEQTKSLKDIRNNISVLNTNIVNAEEERMYEKRDAEKTVSDISKFASVKLLDIEPEALSKLEKIISKSKAADGGGLSLTDAIGSSAILKKTLEAFSKIGPLLQAISQGGLGTTLLAITGGLAGAAASWSLFFKGLNDDQKAYNKRRETEEEDRKRVAEAKTKREDTQARSDLDEVLKTAKAQQYDTTKADVIDQLANTYEEESKKLNDQRRMKIALALRERAKQMREETSPPPSEVPPTVEMQPQVLGIEGKSEALAYDYAPIPTKLNLAEVPTIKSPTVTPKKVVPIITPPKAGAKPAAQVESSFIDNILGKIGSFLPTGVGSLTPTAMAATTPYYSPILSPNKISPTQALEQALRERGLSKQFTAAAIANIFKESAGGMVPENLDYSKTQAERVLTIFGESRILGKNSLTKEQQEKFKEYKQLKPEQQKQFSFLTDEQRAKIKSMTSDINAFTEQVYGGEFGRTQLGNIEKGDALKFKGRGLIQLTGRSNYEAASKALGVDLVSNPELVNDPIIGPKVAAWYLENSSRNRAKKMGLDLNTVSDQLKMNEIVTSAVAGPTIKRGENTYLGSLLSKVDMLVNSYNKDGSQIYAAAANNKAMQQQTQGNNVVAVNNNVVTNNQTTMPNVRPRPEEPYNPLKLLYNLYPTL